MGGPRVPAQTFGFRRRNCSGAGDPSEGGRPRSVAHVTCADDRWRKYALTCGGHLLAASLMKFAGPNKHPPFVVGQAFLAARTRSRDVRPRGRILPARLPMPAHWTANCLALTKAPLLGLRSCQRLVLMGIRSEPQKNGPHSRTRERKRDPLDERRATVGRQN